MTVSNALNRKTFAGNGVTTSFDTSPAIFYLSSDLTVQVVTDATGAAITLVENTNYTVSGGNGSTGTVNLAAGSAPFGAPATGTTLVILRVMSITQGSDLVNNDASDAEVAERTIDRVTLLTQQLQENVDRSVRFPTSEGLSGVLPALASRAGKFLGFDASTGALVMAAALSAVFSSAVVGQIPFGITGGTFGQDSNLTWDNALKQLTTSSLRATAAGPSTARTIDAGTNDGLQHSIRIFGDNAADKAPVLSLYRTNQKECFIASASSSMLFGVTNGVANFNDATLNAASQLTIGATGVVTIPASVVTPVVGTATSTDFFIKHNNQNRYVFNNGYAAPVDDNFVASGQPDKRWTAVFALSLDSGTTGPLSLGTNNGVAQVNIPHTASVVNQVELQGGAAGNPALFGIGGVSSDTNASVVFYTKGTGSFFFNTAGNSATQFVVVHTASAVNQLQASGRATGLPPSLIAIGADTDVGILVATKGVGSINFASASGASSQFQVLNTTSSTRAITVTGSNGGNPTLSVTAGNLAITPTVAIAGSVLVGTNPSSSGAVNLAYATGLYTRNSANNNDLNLIASATQNSVVDIVSIGIAGSTVGVMWKARSGGAAPTTSDLPAGAATVWRDTGGATTKLYYNNAGAIQSVALA